jgi:hypothetical protein
MKITVIKKAANSKVKAACPWVVDDYSDGAPKSRVK